MISLLVIFGCIILFLILNIVLNRILINHIKNKNGRYQLSGLPICLFIFIVLCALVLPKVIIPTIEYNSFEDYLFWTEGYQIEGVFGIDAYYDDGRGVIYSFGNQTVSGFAMKEDNGSLKNGRIRFLKGEILQTETVGIYMSLYEVLDKDLRIFIFTQMDTMDFQITVNGVESEIYTLTKNMRSKINVLTNTSNYNVVLEGQSFTIT